MPTIQEIQERFRRDRFATDAAGITITEAQPQYAVCEMPLLEKHRNARGTPMGGAIFTLADFTAAIAANGFSEHTETISLHADITFLGTAKGEKLIAAAKCVKQGRTTSLYTVEVTDELGTLVAQASVNGFVLPK
ncbi:MAG: PaaI family thioesterase [Faecousia sp.]